MVGHKTLSIAKVGRNDDSNNNQPNEESVKESDEESEEESGSHEYPCVAMTAEAIDNDLEDNVIMTPNSSNQQCELELKQHRNSKILALKKRASSKHYNAPLFLVEETCKCLPNFSRSRKNSWP